MTQRTKTVIKWNCICTPVCVLITWWVLVNMLPPKVSRCFCEFKIDPALHLTKLLNFLAWLVEIPSTLKLIIKLLRNERIYMLRSYLENNYLCLLAILFFKFLVMKILSLSVIFRAYWSCMWFRFTRVCMPLQYFAFLRLSLQFSLNHEFQITFQLLDYKNLALEKPK